MTTSNTEKPLSVNDRGFRIEYAGKELRGIQGSGFLWRSPILFDHFVTGAGAINSSVPQNWVTTETGAATPFVTASTREGGLAVAVTGGTTNNAEELAGKNVNWTPVDMGISSGMTLEVRAKFVGTTTATDGDFYLGFADAVTYTNSLPYVLSAASAFTTSAPSDFVGFGYTSIPTSGTAFASGGNPIVAISSIASVDTVTALSNGGVVVKDSLFHIYRVEVDSVGNAAFWIDDVFKGSVGSATTAATAFTPYINVVAKNSHTHTATIDYIYVKGDLI